MEAFVHDLMEFEASLEKPVKSLMVFFSAVFTQFLIIHQKHFPQATPEQSAAVMEKYLGKSFDEWLEGQIRQRLRELGWEAVEEEGQTVRPPSGKVIPFPMRKLE